MHREQHKRTLILLLWGLLMACVVVGSLLPAASPVIVVVGRMHISDKMLHFGAYLVLSVLPLIGFRERRRGMVAGLSMFLLGLLLEDGQQFSPGRAVEFGDVIANGAGVVCGVLLAPPIRLLLALL
jgi:VanZ family protein